MTNLTFQVCNELNVHIVASPEHDWDCGLGMGPQLRSHWVTGHLRALAKKKRSVIGEHHFAHWARKRSRRRCHLRRHQWAKGKRQGLRIWEMKGGKVKRAAKEIGWEIKKKNLCNCVCVCRRMWMHVDSRFSRGCLCSCCCSTGPGGCWILSTRSCACRAFFCLWAPDAVFSTGGRQREEWCR